MRDLSRCLLRWQPLPGLPDAFATLRPTCQPVAPHDEVVICGRVFTVVAITRLPWTEGQRLLLCAWEEDAPLPPFLPRLPACACSAAANQADGAHPHEAPLLN